MNVGEFVEQREAVQEPPRVDKLLTLCIFPVESEVLAHMIMSASIPHADARGFLVNVNKFV